VDIGSRIRAARKAAGLSQEELARRADMSLKGMSYIERGHIGDPHLSSLNKIAVALNMSVGELLEESLGKVLAPH
jgi:transcriptional regulator with XRE-family HTH domain